MNDPKGVFELNPWHPNDGRPATANIEWETSTTTIIAIRGQGGPFKWGPPFKWHIHTIISRLCLDTPFSFSWVKNNFLWNPRKKITFESDTLGNFDQIVFQDFSWSREMQFPPFWARDCFVAYTDTFFTQNTFHLLNRVELIAQPYVKCWFSPNFFRLIKCETIESFVGGWTMKFIDGEGSRLKKNCQTFRMCCVGTKWWSQILKVVLSGVCGSLLKLQFRKCIVHRRSALLLAPISKAQKTLEPCRIDANMGRL